MAFNASQLPFPQETSFIDLSFCLMDKGSLIGGINALLYCWGCLYIDALWVSENYRHSGYGSQLLRRTEEEARIAGAHMAHLDTFDFQAKDFYLKHGYQVFGTLDTCPVRGHSRFYMAKQLTNH